MLTNKYFIWSTIAITIMLSLCANIMFRTLSGHVFYISVNIAVVLIILILRFQHLKARGELRQLIYQDELTGAHNRRFFNMYMSKAIPLANSTKQPLHLVVIDIDNFKHINDTCGHLFGDTVLVDMVTIVNHIIREDDCFVRFGGEEFILVLPNTTKECAEVIANRIRFKIETAIFKHKNERVPVTISLGLSSYDSSDTLEQWIAKSDDALYKAKAFGKNQVFSY